MPSLPFVAELRRFSMNFLLSSGCCSSLRWKKGEEEEGQEESWEVESGVGSSRRDNHMEDHDDDREWSADKART